MSEYPKYPDSTSYSSRQHNYKYDQQTKEKRKQTDEENQGEDIEASTRNSFASSRVILEHLRKIHHDTHHRWSAYCIPTKSQWIKIGIMAVYLIIGYIFYKHYEGWSFGKTLGFTIVTIATVGESPYSLMFSIDPFSPFFHLIQATDIHIPQQIHRDYSRSFTWFLVFILYFLVLPHRSKTVWNEQQLISTHSQMLHIYFPLTIIIEG
jgi:hypothetical protein